MANPAPPLHDPPPVLRPDEKPTPSEMAKLARALLQERASVDPQLAEKMRERGLPLTGRTSRQGH